MLKKLGLLVVGFIGGFVYAGYHLGEFLMKLRERELIRIDQGDDVAAKSPEHYVLKKTILMDIDELL